MSALAEALLAAQRSALAAIGKAYVARSGTLDDADAVVDALDAMGCTDKIEQAQLLCAWDVLAEHGATTTNETPAPKEDRPASEAQWKLLRRLAEEKGTMAPDGPLTSAQASKAINELKAGTYNSDAYTVPF